MAPRRGAKAAGAAALLCLSVSLALGLLTPTAVVVAIYPDVQPYMDRCVGKSPQSCKKKAHFCTWSVSSYPQCFETAYLDNPPVPQTNFSLARTAYEFSFGVHLSEGNNQEWHYVDSPDECALLCFTSATTTGIRCLSFDYYPVETPLPMAPYFETVTTGTCVLNSENKDSARLRNEDEGFTDAELLYSSHFSHRPFSGIDGYYELRDPRGGQIDVLLSYNPDPNLPTNNLWPKSRWGMKQLTVPKLPSTMLSCYGPDTGTDNGPITPGQAGFLSGTVTQGAGFFGAFTPVDVLNHCPGMMNKSQALQICAAAGGTLCAKADELASNNNNLGCGIDTFPIWSAADAEFSKKGQPVVKFVRCCATYRAVSTCSLYSKSQINWCAGFTTASDCIYSGSGTNVQYSLGFGRFQNQMRANCAANPSQCRGLVRPWSIRDSCLWCLKPGQGQSGGAGECRPGNDYGVCATAPLTLQQLFALKVATQCDDNTVCRVANTFPEKIPLLNIITRSPTQRPTSKSPTKFPTWKPTKAPSTTKPSAAPSSTRPSRSPSSAPSRAPSGAPTKAPVAGPQPTTASPSTSQPTTASPLASPSTAPTLSPGMVG